MTKLRLDLDETVCGPPERRQVITGARVRVVETKPTDEQRAMSELLRASGGVATIVAFEVDGPPDDAHRAAALGAIRRAVWSSYREPDSVALYPSRIGEPTREIAWASSLRRMLIEPPYGVQGEPASSRWLTRFVDAWLGANVFERLRTDPFAIDARAFGTAACPDYFRAGAEWWGTFLFTFQPTSAPRIVAMTASATD